MLRPKMIIEWFKARAELNRNEFAQLADGLLPGGQIVVGGSPANARKVLNTLSNLNRIGRVTALSEATLRLDQPTTFDSAAIVQLLMMAKNETFHETIDMAIAMVTQIMADGHDPSVALQLLKENADKVGRL